MAMRLKALFKVCLILFAISLSTSPGAMVGASLSHVSEAKLIDEGEIRIGGSKTFSYPLNKLYTYNVYLTWANGQMDVDRTDYDLYVYDPSGGQVIHQTQASGLPEHLTTGGEPYYQPNRTGDYKFKVVNDVAFSNGMQAAALMVIECVETDVRYRDRLYMRGLDSRGRQGYYTTWGYAFKTRASYFEIQLKVPDTLDMYEGRLFLMAEPAAGVGELISEAPIPPYPLLSGGRSGVYGGYNLDPKGYRGNAFVSFEHAGRDMAITFNASSTNEKLYYLALIAEYGCGYVDFIIKTDFNPPRLQAVDPFTESVAGRTTRISVSAVDEEAGVDRVSLNYTADGWETSREIGRTRSEGDVYSVSIPAQRPGTRIDWMFKAVDVSGNDATMESSFRVKGVGGIECEASDAVIEGGEEITINGYILPELEREEVQLRYQVDDLEVSRTVTTDGHGAFSDRYTPNAAGEWLVSAYWSGGEAYFNASSTARFRVESLPSTLSIYAEKEEIKMGESITISGELTPRVGDALIDLFYTDPEGRLVPQKVSTSPSGRFYATYTPDSSGSWSVQATWSGERFYEQAVSNSVAFRVKTGLQIGLFTGIALIGALAAVVTAVFLIRRRRRAAELVEEEEYIQFT